MKKRTNRRNVEAVERERERVTFRKIKNLPLFLVVGIILMIVIIISIYYIFLRYAPEIMMPYSGYAIEAQTMVANLKSDNISEVERYIDLVEVKEQELVYKKLNSYYVGEKDKTEIDIKYPIYINEQNTILNLSRDTKLITTNYEMVEGYPEFLLTGGVMYNGDDLTRADGNEYLFLKTDEDIYTNAEKIEIETEYNTYEIEANSNIYFTEGSIRYYELKGTYIEYHNIEDIDNESKIKIKGEEITYQEFLERLGKLDEEEETGQEEEINNEIENNTVEEEDAENVNEESKDENDENEPDGNNEITDNDGNNNESEPTWVKPEVSCTDFEGQVYSAKTELTIEDVTGEITRGIIFEVYREGRLNRRVQVTSGGVAEISGLNPDTEYEIIGIFYYTDEEEIEQTEEFYRGVVQTKSIDTLGAIKLNFENGDIYSNKVEIKNIKIGNELTEEVVKGITRLYIEISGIQYSLSTEQINQLKNGEEITYQTGENVKSNQKIRYEIKAYDKYGNELKIEKGEGETRTSKEEPTVTIQVRKQDVVEVELNLNLANKDNVELENYRYIIIDQSGNIVKEESLSGNRNTLSFTDLDPNNYYKIEIHADYDTEDGRGMKQNQIIGSGYFTTLPITSLGYLHLNIEEKETTSNSIEVEITINEEQTDRRLIQILEKLDITIRAENGEEYSKELTEDELASLKVAEGVTVKFSALQSNTKYTISTVAVAKQGSIEEAVETRQSIGEITTLKIPAEVQIRNQFVIGDMIDFDVRVEDIDNAVLTGKVRIEVRDEQDKLVSLEEIDTNQEYSRKTYENLEENTTYKIIFYAPQYNEGHTDNTYKADYIIKQIEIYTEPGISGELGLERIGKAGTGKNLLDVSSKVNWYAQCFNYGDGGGYYGLTYDEGAKILTLGSSEMTVSYRQYLYDLTDYVGEEVTISFQAKITNQTNMNIMNGSSAVATINNLTADWQEYSYTLTVSENGYVGFRIVSSTGEVEIQNLQVELGNQKTSYEEFKYKLNADVNISLTDARDEITTNDYYVRIYKNGEQIEEERYEEIGEENKIENAKKSYEVEENASYELELLVKIQDRYYTLDSQTIEVEAGTEIKGISSLDDYLKIQPYGRYIVLTDIDLSNVPSVNAYRFGGSNIQFEGRIDFNGKTVTKDTSSGEPMFYIIGSNGIIENLVLDIKMDNEVAIEGYRGISTYNYGTVKNTQMNIIETTEKENSFTRLVCLTNYGVIENFVVDFKEPLYISGMGNGSVLCFNNYGAIRNGYIYGENIKMIGGNQNYAGVVAYQNLNNALVENIYSLVSVDLIGDTSVTKKAGNIVYNNQNNSTVQNVYSVGIGENTTDYAHGPNVYNANSQKVYNSYYFADEIFTNEYNIKGNKLSLWDAEFQNQIINTSNAFEVDSLVNEGYYPQLKMPDVMPRQDYIELPEVEDADLPDILSTKILEQGTNTVKVEFSVNNPSAAQIDSIEIENVTVNILSQEYKDGKSTVVAELTNPIMCVSSYDVLSITTRGAFNNTYTQLYERGERVIYVDLYKEIWSVSDWKNIANSNTENYMLMTDLDFINEGNTVYLSLVNGIINGNNHTISNVNLTSNYGLITYLYGELKNINFKNFNLINQTTGGYYGGIVNIGESGSIIDNIHIVDMTVTRTAKSTTYRVGGIASYANSNTIRNSSVTNLTIKEETSDNVDMQYIGGIVGYGTNSTIENCYVQNININVSNATTTYTGGILGYDTQYGSIQNCYAQGRIISEGSNVGGIAGSMTNGNIKNCYSMVNISSESSSIGGIAGNISNNKEEISNNLSIGDIYTTVGQTGLNRIIGNGEDTTSSNYAYEKQKINGYIEDDELGATLLSKEQILNLSLGESYSYEGKEEGILPKLYNTEKTELLPNQQDNKIENDEEVNLEIESIEAEKTNTTEAQISIIIDNPQEVEITGIEIEDMECTVTRNVTQNGKTNIVVRGLPRRYYDSYKITQIKYKNTSDEENGNTLEEQIKEVEVQVNIQFYKELYSYEDWQTIEEGTYQNYRLMSDIDFSGRTDVKTNVTMNRLEAEDAVYTLKNLNIELKETSAGFIKNIKTNMKNIGFNNITIKNTVGSGNYCGVIATNNGELENLTFSNIKVEAAGMSYVGAIGNVSSGFISNVTLDTINITGAGYIGGLTGRCDYEVSNINAKNITINATGNYAGGIIGYAYNTSTINPDQIYIEITSSNITGTDNVGGITGYSYSVRLTNSSVSNTNITGASYVGGMTGYKDLSASYYCYYNTVDTCEISGNGSRIGGLNGDSTSYEQYAVVENSKIIGTTVNSNYVGGVIRLSII